MIRAALIIAALTATPAHAAGPDTHRAERTIRLDLGGDVGARANRIARMIRQGQTVRIAGTCASACTMYLATGCVTPGATLYLHTPQVRAGSSLTRAEWAEIIAAHYPTALAALYLSGPAHHARATKITGAQAISMGARACE